MMFRRSTRISWLLTRIGYMRTCSSGSGPQLLIRGSSMREVAARHETDHLPPTHSQRAITKALAPFGSTGELPPGEIDDLDGLYSALMDPLPVPPSRSERVAAMRNTQTDPDVFFATRECDLSNYAHLVRCLGIQGDLDGAQAAFDAIEKEGLVPDHAAYSALMEACMRNADVNAAEAVLRQMNQRQVRPLVPIWTGLVGAYLNSGASPHKAHEVLERMRRAGATENVVIHTLIMRGYAKAHMYDEAWSTFDEMRIRGIQPDSVTFSTMLMVCSSTDQFEQAQGLLIDMKLSKISPDAATHTSFINACASRAAALIQLPKEKKVLMRKLAVDIAPQSAVDAASRQMAQLQEDGFAPDGLTYQALLRVYAAAADVPGAQRVLTRMLDEDVPPTAAHFHHLLRACTRAQQFGDTSEMERNLQVASSVVPSMQALGMPVDAKTCELLVDAYARANRIHRAFELLETLPSRFQLQPSLRAHECVLKMAQRIHRADVAAQVIAKMEDIGLPISEDHRAITQAIEDRRNTPSLNYPQLPEVAFSRMRGRFVRPSVPPRVAARWQSLPGDRKKRHVRANLLRERRRRHAALLSGESTQKHPSLGDDFGDFLLDGLSREEAHVVRKAHAYLKEIGF
eukprot:CAMPEP_0119307358 /NCGR_PEP_ID=MMETSP1333-20130426/7886_1 /TAXON_ID=418940 /ORGANISM="Scyphosphaera apsteinii, Strain RCC1455" /LENGTH=627 /DNA_ID=CAMNT_0007310891 /DNA_START=39 /DNA_END=1922 /DNA_ORIENTATION=+